MTANDPIADIGGTGLLCVELNSGSEQFRSSPSFLGCITLGGWLLFTRADETGVSILRQSLWSIVILPTLLAIPLAIAALIADIALGNFLPPALLYVGGLIGLVLFEEAIKLRPSRLRRSGIQAFALVSLFGIFELALFKPVLTWGVSASATEIFCLQSSLLPAVVLHVLTAAIYAFHFRQSPKTQFAICAGVHFLFNLTADQSDILDCPIWLATIIPLAAAVWWLVPKKGSIKRGNWQLELAEPAALQ